MSTPQPVSRVCGGTLATLACGATLLVWEKLACGGSLAKPRKRIPCHDPTNRSPVSPDPLSHPCHDPLSPVTDPRSTPPPPPPLRFGAQRCSSTREGSRMVLALRRCHVGSAARRRRQPRQPRLARANRDPARERSPIDNLDINETRIGVGEGN